MTDDSPAGRLPTRLCEAALNALGADVGSPRYDRSAVTCGIVHLGIGAFHRAHQAVYIDDVLALGDNGWGITGASLRHPNVRDALSPQDGLYTLSVRSDHTESLRVIGSVKHLVVAAEDPEGLIARMADPGTRIVSLTVTEKGYCHDPATGELDEEHPDIEHDLVDLYHPRSAVGFIVAALASRFAAGLPPFTVLSCDNLPANGRTVKRVIDRFASLVSPELGEWVASEVCCPATMIDRIVPATTGADRARISTKLGCEDAWPVVTEPFSQWVVEDKFPAGRPDLAAVGVQLVDDVTPYELMKLRMLNGSHSTLAYLGYLTGYETVADTVSDPAFAELIRGLMDEEVAPTLPRAPEVDPGAYRDALMARFANTALRHRCSQICMDGSQKLPQRLLNTVRARLKAAAPFPRLALGVAGWMRYVAGTDEQGNPIDVRDPFAERFEEIAKEAGGHPARLVEELLGIREIFGEDLPADPRFRDAVTAALETLYRKGAGRAVEALARKPAADFAAGD